MCVKIPLKYSVSFIFGFIKVKNAARIHQELLNEWPMTLVNYSADERISYLIER